jgi:hypothetical protein
VIRHLSPIQQCAVKYWRVHRQERCVVVRTSNNKVVKVPFAIPRSSGIVRPRRLVLAVLVLASIGVLLGACGSTGPAVAGLGSTTSTTNASPVSLSTQLLKYGACIRSHGVPHYPDPIQNGNSLTFMKVKSAQFATAQAACLDLLPAGVLPPLQITITAKDQTDYLKAVACVRSYGFPQVPDPTFTGGKVHIAVPSSIDQSSPAFEKALATCRKLIPSGLPYGN